MTDTVTDTDSNTAPRTGLSPATPRAKPRAELRTVYRCETCGSDDVQLCFPVWIPPNGDGPDDRARWQPDHGAEPEGDSDKGYCKACGKTRAVSPADEPAPAPAPHPTKPQALVEYEEIAKRAGVYECRFVVLFDVPGSTLAEGYKALRLLFDAAQALIGESWPGFETADEAFTPDGEPVTAEELQAARDAYFFAGLEEGAEEEGGAR